MYRYIVTFIDSRDQEQTVEVDADNRLRAEGYVKDNYNCDMIVRSEKQEVA